MKKSLAEIAYETYSSSFAIGIQGDHKGGCVSHGPAPYHKLPPMDKARWQQVALAIKQNIDPLDCIRSHAARDPNGPTVCQCGARFLKGEQHTCVKDLPRS